jgi:hypothetical protein
MRSHGEPFDGGRARNLDEWLTELIGGLGVQGSA